MSLRTLFAPTLVTVLSLSALAPVASAASFSDVPSTHPNAEAIAYVKAQGIVSGYADGTYRPNQTINRAEFTKIITKFTSYPWQETNDRGETYEQWVGHFSDVQAANWFAPFVYQAARLGIVAGYPDGTFQPGRAVNFAEAAKMIVVAIDPNDFTAPIAKEGAPWYERFVTYLELQHAIPLTITRFDQPITRGEMAEMIWRLKAGVTNKPSRTYGELSGQATSKTSSSVKISWKEVSTKMTDRVNRMRYFPSIDHHKAIAALSAVQRDTILRRWQELAKQFSLDANASADTVLYRNDDLHIQFRYPRSWGSFTLYQYACYDEQMKEHPTEAVLWGVFANVAEANQRGIGAMTRDCSVDRGRGAAESLSFQEPNLPSDQILGTGEGQQRHLWYAFPYGYATEATYFAARVPVVHPHFTHLGLVGPYSNSPYTTEQEVRDFLTVAHSFTITR